MVADDPRNSESLRSASYGRSFDDERVIPADLKVKLAEQKLLVQWKDGAASEFAFDFLRSRCPCATCRTEREKEKPLLPILRIDPSGDIRVTTAKLVGRYAIQFTWSDGHSTGIFDFRYLRSLPEGIAD